MPLGGGPARAIVHAPAPGAAGGVPGGGGGALGQHVLFTSVSENAGDRNG